MSECGCPPDFEKRCAFEDCARKPVSEWRPIETAPKDGTAVLTFRSAKLIAVAEWDAGCGYWIVTDGMPLVNVTHWMPLPEPPDA